MVLKTAFCDPHKNLSVKYQLFAVMATHLSQTMGVLGELDICHPMACRVCLESQFLAGHVYLSWPVPSLNSWPQSGGGYCPPTPRGIVAENYFASLQYLSSPESTRIFYIYKSPIYFWINLVSISPAWVHFERRLGRLTEVERVCENSAVWCASHHCLGVAASSAMLGPGRIGTRGILRGINQVRVGFVTEGSIQGKFTFYPAVLCRIPCQKEVKLSWMTVCTVLRKPSMSERGQHLI